MHPRPTEPSPRRTGPAAVPPPRLPVAQGAGRPLLVTDDQALLDDLLRVAAQVDVEVEVRPALSATGSAWAAAPVVVVGATVARRGGPPSRRSGVVLVGGDLDDAAVWDSAVSLGAEHVVLLPDAAPWLADLLRDTCRPAVSGLVVGVTAASGGAGASCLAVALGLAAARDGRSALLVDADPLGGGLDVTLGAEDVPGPRWPELLATPAATRAQGLARLRGLPSRAGLPFLSCARPGVGPPTELVLPVLQEAAGLVSLVVADLSRGPAEEAAGCDTVLLVAVDGVRTAAAAAAVAQHLARHGAGPRLVVRTGSPGAGGARARELAAALRLPLAAVLRAEPDLDADLARGVPPGSRPRGPLARAAGRLLLDLDLDGVAPGLAA